jgi:dsRNA-specific ribonuclease
MQKNSKDFATHCSNNGQSKVKGKGRTKREEKKNKENRHVHRYATLADHWLLPVRLV